MSLTLALNSLVGSLNLSQTQLGSLSDNIANVNTEGYTKKEIVQTTRVSNGTVVGVAITELRRSIDEFLNAAARSQQSQFGAAEVKNDYYERIQEFVFGVPNSEFTLSATFDSFYSSLESFANDPGSAVKASFVVSSAQNVADSLNTTATGIQNERLNADTEVGQLVDDLEAALNDLGDINEAIKLNGVAGADVTRLLDARDEKLIEVQEILDVDIRFDEFGQASVSLSNAELLGFSQRYSIDYSRATSIEQFINNSTLGAITVTALDAAGNLTLNVETLLSESNATELVDNITTGKLRSLIDLRDTELPRITDQLDALTFSFAQAFNEIHNNGSGYPPAEELTGTQSFLSTDEFLFSGSTRITLVDSDGLPLEDRFGGSLLPLEIDFDEFNGGNGKGTASVQDIINEINSYYSTQPQNIVNIGNARDLRIASLTNNITSVEASNTITFSANPADGDDIVINGVTFSFADSPTGTDIQRGSSLETTLNNLEAALNNSSNASVSAATYSVTGNVFTITNNTGGTNGNAFTFDGTNGGTNSYSTDSGNLIGGADVTGDFTFDFEFTNVDPAGGNLTIDVTSVNVASTGTPGAAAFSAAPVAAGVRSRSFLSSDTSQGSLSITLDSYNLEEGDTFAIEFDISITDADGVVSTETVTFNTTVPDPNTDVMNQRYSPSAISGSGSGEIISGSSNNAYMTARLVDANGNAVADGESGFLQLSTTNNDIRVSIDQLDSSHDGLYGAVDPTASATSKGLSHFFGLNDFFTYGNQLQNSAINLGIRSDITSTPNLVTRGVATQSLDDVNGSVYSYGVSIGSNSSAIELARIQDQNLGFLSAGTLPNISTTTNSYITEIFNFAALQTNNAKGEFEKQQLLTDGINRKIDEISGVNIDSELADTIRIQNSFAASARALSAVRTMFEKLEESLT